MTVKEMLGMHEHEILIIFAILIYSIILYKIISIVIASYKASRKEIVPPTTVAVESQNSASPLILENVDDTTAAYIMAIVAEESGIPPHQLIFTSIKAIS